MRGQINSSMKAWKLISKCFPYNVVRVKDLECETSSIESVHVVREFPKVFLNDLPSVFPKWDIFFSIDLLANTNPISIPPYRMALDELKELKQKLKHSLDSGFIQRSISRWGGLILCVMKKDRCFRICIDYGQFIKVIIMNKYPLPMINDIFDQILGFIYFSKIDLCLGYR